MDVLIGFSYIKYLLNLQESIKYKTHQKKSNDIFWIPRIHRNSAMTPGKNFSHCLPELQVLLNKYINTTTCKYLNETQESENAMAIGAAEQNLPVQLRVDI